MFTAYIIYRVVEDMEAHLRMTDTTVGLFCGAAACVNTSRITGSSLGTLRPAEGLEVA